MNGQPGAVNGDAGRISGGTRPADPQEVTQLLANWSHGDQAAFEKLIPLVYEELRHLAHRYMEGQRPNHTLQTTALVNEAYLRLAEQNKPDFTNRSHFFAVAAKRCVKSWSITQRRRGVKSVAQVQAKLIWTRQR
jgi:RNA polymerase sigma factor (TIGR02999 family)